MLKEFEGKTVWQVTLVNSPDFSGFFFEMEALTQLLSQRQGVYIFPNKYHRKFTKQGISFLNTIILRMQDEGVHKMCSFKDCTIFS